MGFELGQVVGLSLLVGEVGAFCRNDTDCASHTPSPGWDQALLRVLSNTGERTCCDFIPKVGIWGPGRGTGLVPYCEVLRWFSWEVIGHVVILQCWGRVCCCVKHGLLLLLFSRAPVMGRFAARRCILILGMGFYLWFSPALGHYAP